MSGGGRNLNWNLRGSGGDPVVEVPDHGSQPRVGLGGPPAGVWVGRGDFRKAGVGTECRMSETPLEKVGVLSPFQGGAEIDGFQLMTQPPSHLDFLFCG